MDVFDVSVRDILNPNFEAENIEADQEALNSIKLSGVRKKRRPTVKLDTVRLLGKTGLPSLDTQLKDFKFKGKGHEAQDLCRLMKHYETWCKQLIDVVPFENCIEKFEELGHKKTIKIALRQYRADLGLVGLSSEFVTDYPSDNENKPNKVEKLKATDIDYEEFDERDFIELPLESYRENMSQEKVVAVVEPPKQLSEEVLLRIEENRNRALERLRASRAEKERKALEEAASSQLYVPVDLGPHEMF